MAGIYESMFGLHIIMSQNILLKIISIVVIKYSAYQCSVFVSIKKIFWKIKKKLLQVTKTPYYSI